MPLNDSFSITLELSSVEASHAEVLEGLPERLVRRSPQKKARLDLAYS